MRGSSLRLAKTTMRFFSLPILAIMLSGCVGLDRPPHTFTPPIAEEYHACQKCGSLHGGIYGKGPLASFKKDGANACRHRWSRIEKQTFQKRAKEEHPEEWKAAPPFFRQGEADIEESADQVLRPTRLLHRFAMKRCSRGADL